MRLVDSGSSLIVVDTDSITFLDARSLRLIRTVRITPAPVAPVAAAVSPDGHAVTIGSETGSVSFVDSTTGTLRSAA
jgi:hypothetical protein